MPTYDLERDIVCVTDGDVGSVVSVLLDDNRWIVLVVQADTPGPQSASQHDMS